MKRELVQTGMDQMFARELVKKQFSANGIIYEGSDMTAAFVRLLTTPYATKLKERARWIADTFSERSDGDMQEFMATRVGAWGMEFETLAAIGDLEV